MGRKGSGRETAKMIQAFLKKLEILYQKLGLEQGLLSPQETGEEG